MSCKFILAVGMVGFLAATSLAAPPADARGFRGGFHAAKSSPHGRMHFRRSSAGRMHLGKRLARGRSTVHHGRSHFSASKSAMHHKGNHALAQRSRAGRLGKIANGSNKIGNQFGKLANLQANKSNKALHLADGPGKKNAGFTKPLTKGPRLASLDGGQQGSNNGAASNSLRSGSKKLAAGPGSGGLKKGQGQIYRETNMPPNQNGPTSQNGTTQNPKTQKPKPPQGNMGPIIVGWRNAFVDNLRGSYDPGSIGTGYSACALLANCLAAGAPPGLVEVLMLPLNSPPSNAFEGAVNGFRPADPKDPLSSPIDKAVKSIGQTGTVNPLDPFSSPQWPQTGPAANPAGQ